LGLVLALLPTYLVRFTIFGLPTTLLEIILAIFLLAVFFTHPRSLVAELKKLGPANLAIIAFVLAGIISTIISPEPIKALGQLKAFIIEPVLFFYACVLILRKESDLKLPLTLLSLSILVISLFGLIQYVTLLGLPLRFWGFGEGVKRIVSVFEYPNALALYLGPLLAFFLALIYSKSTLINRKLLFWTTGLGLIALILTFSRGAWLAVLVVLAILAAKKIPWKIVVPFLALAITAAALLYPGKQILTDPSASARLELYKYSARAVLQSPILGNGLSGFRHTLESMQFKQEVLNYPHNIFLNFWLELGMLGLLSFFFLILVCLKQHKLKPTPLRLAAAMFLVTIVVHGLVDVPYFKNDLSILFWFMISLFYIKN